MKDADDGDELHGSNNVVEPKLPNSDLCYPPESPIKLAKSALGKQVLFSLAKNCVKLSVIMHDMMSVIVGFHRLRRKNVLPR